MANLKDIVATLAILGAGSLALTACEKEGATTTPDDAAAAEGEASCSGDKDAEASCSGEAAADGEASCSGEAAADGEASCSGEADAEDAAADGEASCSGAS